MIYNCTAVVYLVAEFVFVGVLYALVSYCYVFLGLSLEINEFVILYVFQNGGYIIETIKLHTLLVTRFALLAVKRRINILKCDKK